MSIEQQAVRLSQARLAAYRNADGKDLQAVMDLVGVDIAEDLEDYFVAGPLGSYAGHLTFDIDEDFSQAIDCLYGFGDVEQDSSIGNPIVIEDVNDEAISEGSRVLLPIGITTFGDHLVVPFKSIELESFSATPGMVLCFFRELCGFGVVAEDIRGFLESLKVAGDGTVPEP